MTELYKEYRPTSLDEIHGQAEAVEMLSEWLENDRVPQTILFAGPSGCGKTTLARILANELGCVPDSGNSDFLEQNCAKARGIDTIRELDQLMRYTALGKSRVFVLDEIHRLTSDAQSALLKMTEDTPPDVYFFLCTTDPNKIIKTLRNRATQVVVRLLDDETLETLIKGVIKAEKITYIKSDVIKSIVSAAQGSARRALVILNQILGLMTEAEQLKAVGQADVEKNGLDIARLLFARGTTWKAMADALRALGDDQDIEGIRRIILGYAASVLLNSGSDKAASVIMEFEKAWYDSGKPSLILCCHRIISAK